MAITISDTEPRVQYTATSGQTSFAVPFEFFTNADIKVFNGTSQLTFNASPSSASQYSVSGAGVSGGGSITLGGSGATLNDVITIYRDLAISRSTDFPTSGAFQINSLNDELDKIIAMCQQLERDLKFSPRAAATTANTFDITFPNLAANKVLSVNSAGNGLEFAQDITDITTIAGIASDVTTVSGIASNVTAVAGAVTNVNTVASNITNINTVATNIADIVTVANDLNEAVSEIETVASDLQEASPEIDTVATNITNVNAVGNNITNINTVAGISADITTIASVGSTDLTALATNASSIATVAADVANMNTVAGSITNVNSVGGSIANVNSVASNLSGINSFAERYRISSSAPSTSLDVGDLYFDTTADELKVYKSSGWAAAGSTVNGTANRFHYSVSSSTTTITGADDSGSVLAYDAGFVDVYLNGVRMSEGDITSTSGTSIVFASAIGTSGTDEVDIVAYGTFELANISINDLTDTPAALGSAGQALVVNSGGTALEYSNASSAEVYGFKTTFTPSTINITVTDSGGYYYIDGIQQKTLSLLEGNTYIFTHPSSHPFRFSTNANNSPSAPYTTGVTVNSSTQVTIVVASGAPTLYYYCSSHSGMGGTANTPVPADNTLQIQTTNQGADNITQAEYESFDDVQYAASGFTWSINNGKLTATV